MTEPRGPRQQSSLGLAQKARFAGSAGDTLGFRRTYVRDEAPNLSEEPGEMGLLTRGESRSPLRNVPCAEPSS